MIATLKIARLKIEKNKQTTTATIQNNKMFDT